MPGHHGSKKKRGSSNGPSPSVGRIGAIRSGRRDAGGANSSGSGSPGGMRVMRGLSPGRREIAATIRPGKPVMRQ